MKVLKHIAALLHFFPPEALSSSNLPVLLTLEQNVQDVLLIENFMQFIVSTYFALKWVPIEDK